jgi:hypothetical protein
MMFVMRLMVRGGTCRWAACRSCVLGKDAGLSDKAEDRS